MDERYMENAAALEQAHREAAIAAAMSRPESDPDFDGVHCIACSDDIPEGRLALGKIRCVECQSVREKRRG